MKKHSHLHFIERTRTLSSLPLGLCRVSWDVHSPHCPEQIKKNKEKVSHNSVISLAGYILESIIDTYGLEFPFQPLRKFFTPEKDDLHRVG